jgi:hypothetical protein
VYESSIKNWFAAVFTAPVPSAIEFENPPVEVLLPSKIEAPPEVLFTVSEIPALCPINILFAAFVAWEPALYPKNKEFAAFIAEYPVLYPTNVAFGALIAPPPERYPIKTDELASIASAPAVAPRNTAVVAFVAPLPALVPTKTVLVFVAPLPAPTPSHVSVPSSEVEPIRFDPPLTVAQLTVVPSVVRYFPLFPV